MSKLDQSSHRRPLFLAVSASLAVMAASLALPVAAQEPAAYAAILQQSGPNAAPDEPIGLVPELSTATSNTYRESDGSMRLEAFTEPVNYLSGDDAWVPIDNELVPAPGVAYEAMNAGNSFEAKIPADPSTTPVKFTTDGGWVTMRMHGLDDAPTLDGGVATFDDVDAADEVTYEVTNFGLKEDILLEAAPPASGSPLAYTYSIDASAGIAPYMGDDGAIEFRDSAGEVAVVMPAAYMFDSASPEPATSNDVDYELVAAGAGWRLTVTPSMEWLQDSARAYPVTIDPSLGPEPASKDCWIRDTTPTTSACGDSATYVKVGRSSGPVNYRGLLDFDTSKIPTNAIVDSAEVPLYLDHTQSTSAVAGDYALFRAGGTWSGSSATWNSSGSSGAWVGGDPGGTAYGTLANLNGGTSGFRIFGGNLKDLVQGWVTNPNNKTGLVLKQAGTPTLNVLSFYSSAPAASNDLKRPRLNVNYTLPNRRPATPNGLTLTPGGAGYTTSYAPNISTFVSDDDHDPLTTWFEVKLGSEQIWLGSDETLLETVAAVDVPANELVPGQTYVINAWSNDGKISSPIASHSFVMDVGGMSGLEACASLCVPLSPNVDLMNATLLPGQIQTIDLKSYGLGADDVMGLDIRATTGAWPVGAIGSLTVYNPDFPAPVAPTLSFGASDLPSVGKQVVGTAATSQTGTLAVKNGSATSLTVQIVATAKRTWFDTDEDALSAAEEEPEEVVLDAQLEQPTGEFSGVTLSADQRSEAGISPIELVDTAPGGDGRRVCATQQISVTEQMELCNQRISADTLATGFAQNSGSQTMQQNEEDAAIVAEVRSQQAACPTTYSKWFVRGRLFSCVVFASITTVVLIVEGEDPVYLGSVWWTEKVIVEPVRNLAQVHITTEYHWIKGSHLMERGLLFLETDLDCAGCNDSHYEDIGNAQISAADREDTYDQWTWQNGKLSPTRSVNNSLGIGMVQSSVIIGCTQGGACSLPARTSRVSLPEIRCDHALGVRGYGCVHPMVSPIFYMKIEGGRAPKTATHIRDAQNTLKDNPGRYSDTGPRRALTRKYWGRGTNPNRKIATQKCAALKREDKLTGSCDEYPFASTYEGCYWHKEWCHVRGIPLPDNSLGGSLLGAWYAQWRVLDSDRFYVTIHD